MDTGVRENASRLYGLQQVLNSSNHELEEALRLICDGISSHSFNNSILNEVFEIFSHHLLPSVSLVFFLKHPDYIEQITLDHRYSRYLSVVHGE